VYLLGRQVDLLAGHVHKPARPAGDHAGQEGSHLLGRQVTLLAEQVNLLVKQVHAPARPAG
jgi:hypothetical protein